MFPSCHVQLEDRVDTCSPIQGLVPVVSALNINPIVPDSCLHWENWCASVKKQLLGCVGAECCTENPCFQGAVEYKLNIKVCVCVCFQSFQTRSECPALAVPGALWSIKWRDQQPDH